MSHIFYFDFAKVRDVFLNEMMILLLWNITENGWEPMWQRFFPAGDSFLENFSDLRRQLFWALRGLLVTVKSRLSICLSSCSIFSRSAFVSVFGHVWTRYHHHRRDDSYYQGCSSKKIMKSSKKIKMSNPIKAISSWKGIILS